MKTARVTLESFAPYSQSRCHEVPRLGDKETDDAYAKRTAREHLHVDENGEVFIPAQAFNKALQTAASYLRMRIPGKGQSEYGKHFYGGVTAQQDGLKLDIKKEDEERIIIERLFLSPTGDKKGGKRVWKYYPTISSWKGTLEFYIFDDTITEEVFEKVLAEAGMFIGLGRFRAEKGGFYGRYKVIRIEWVKG